MSPTSNLALSTKHFPKSVIAAWASFDFAHSSFSGIMITFIFPLYFKNVIVTNGHGNLYWGLTMSSSMLVVALITPLLGAMADILNNKKLFLGIFTVASVLCTAVMYFIQPGFALVAAILFIIGNVGYEGGTVFYDAFLPEITNAASYGRVSGYGFAAGYLGSLVILGLVFPFLNGDVRICFLITAAFFTLFAIPLFLKVPEQRHPAHVGAVALTSRGFNQLAATMRRLRQYKNVLWFLIAFFVYNDVILTVISFSGVYADETLKFTKVELAEFFAVIQVVAIVGSVIFGYVTDRRGPKFTIVVTLLIWIGVVTMAYFATTKGSFYFVGIFGGMALGSSQSASRSLMALLTPKEHTAEFFGFYDGFCGKASAIIGPLVFGVLAEVFGSQRPAIFALSAFFIIGLFLLRKVIAPPILRGGVELGAV